MASYTATHTNVPGGQQSVATGPGSPGLPPPMDLSAQMAALEERNREARRASIMSSYSEDEGYSSPSQRQQAYSQAPVQQASPQEERIQLYRELNPGGFNVSGHYGNLTAGGGSRNQVNAGSMSQTQFAAMMAMRPENSQMNMPGRPHASLSQQPMQQIAGNNPGNDLNSQANKLDRMRRQNPGMYPDYIKDPTNYPASWLGRSS